MKTRPGIKEKRWKCGSRLELKERGTYPKIGLQLRLVIAQTKDIQHGEQVRPTEMPTQIQHQQLVLLL